MTRCQHCKKLTHSEDFYVHYDLKDQDKIVELTNMPEWIPKYMYSTISYENPHEYGKLKIGDIYIHFVAFIKKEL